MREGIDDKAFPEQGAKVSIHSDGSFEGLGCVLANTNLNVLTAVFYWFTLKRDEPKKPPDRVACSRDGNQSLKYQYPLLTSAVSSAVNDGSSTASPSRAASTLKFWHRASAACSWSVSISSPLTKQRSPTRSTRNPPGAAALHPVAAARRFPRPDTAVPAAPDPARGATGR